MITKTYCRIIFLIFTLQLFWVPVKATNFNSLGTGTIVFAGTAQQSISGANAFGSLTLNNSTGLVLNYDTKVTGTLTLTTGLIILGSSNLFLSATTTISGTPSATSMIVATGTGQLMKMFTATGSFTYPVGDNTVTAEYSPVTLTFSSGTFGTNAMAGINLVNAKYPYDSVTGSYINRYWTITQQNITAFSCNATFNYLVADIIGTESQMYCEEVNPLPIVEYSPANTSTHQLTALGLTSFGTFTGNRPQYKYLTLKLFLEGLYIGSSTMRAAMDNSGPHWGSTIADEITIELHDPSIYATLKYTASGISLSTSGNATVTIPRTYSGNYYVTIKNQNSLLTVTAAPLLINTTTVNYDFSTAAADAYGSNEKSLGSGVYGIYTGDITSSSTSYPSVPTQDGLVNLLDVNYINSSYLHGDTGYIVGDLNGDAVVDLLDEYLAYNNYLLGIHSITPP
ncbi:MAG: hypothetical protein ABSD71_08545 [Bacteroidales bacterium]|jgi:hypothetical protein